MRRALDTIYSVSGGLAGLFLVLIAVTILIQVGFTILDNLAVTLGFGAPGFVLPSYSEFTGYFLAASTFLAAAYTLKAGAHIRVLLVIDRLPQGLRRWIEVWCAGTGAIFALYLTYWCVLLTVESHEFGDVSPGIVPVPIWIPQLSMTLGAGIFTLALIDEFLIALRTGAPGRGDACETERR